MTHCLLVALAVVASGCGSTETASTSTKSASGSTPNQPSTQAASQSTGSTQSQHTTGTTRERKAAETKPKRQEKAAEAKRQAKQKESIEAVKALEAAAAQVPLRKQYSAREQVKFMRACNRTAKSPHLTCECVLVKQELRKIETGQSLAELLALDFGLSKGISLHRAVHEGIPFPGFRNAKRRIRLPHEILLSVKECESASK